MCSDGCGVVLCDEMFVGWWVSSCNCNCMMGIVIEVKFNCNCNLMKGMI